MKIVSGGGKELGTSPREMALRPATPKPAVSVTPVLSTVYTVSNCRPW